MILLPKGLHLICRSPNTILLYLHKNIEVLPITKVKNRKEWSNTYIIVAGSWLYHQETTCINFPRKSNTLVSQTFITRGRGYLHFKNPPKQGTPSSLMNAWTNFRSNTKENTKKTGTRIITTSFNYQIFWWPHLLGHIIQ